MVRTFRQKNIFLLRELTLVLVRRRFVSHYTDWMRVAYLENTY